MKRLLFFITVVIIGCSTEKKSTDKNFADLTEDEKIKVIGQLGDELKGDFLTYSGQAIFEDSTGREFLDSTVFVQLVMDKDNRFAIRMKFVENQIETDSTFHFQPRQSNDGIGKWSDLGDKFELKFQLGNADNFFKNKNNNGRLEVIDSYSIRLDKSVDEIWIWQTPCKKMR
jgi:hypothetical protein